jgi:hypothetical protein
VVQNIETLFNIDAALAGQPVTHKHITVIGEVRQPVTVRVPLGVSLREVLALAGGAVTPDPVVLDGGAMMGMSRRPGRAGDQAHQDAAGAALRPPVERQAAHPAQRLRRPGHVGLRPMLHVYRLLPALRPGARHQPHKLILLLASGVPLTDAQMAGAMLCCECRTCNYACPVHLAPGDIALNIKHDLVQGRAEESLPPDTPRSTLPDYRRVPMTRLIHRLDLAEV